MAKSKVKEEPVLAEEPISQATEGPTDYRQAVNMTNKPLMGLPIGDGTTISMAAGPFTPNNTHISRPFLNKYCTKFLKRLAKEGKIQLIAGRGGE